MLTPEVQRLREVRLCNINSLCITGSANTNRYEHSVGTAFLAQINIESKLQKHLRLSKQDKELYRQKCSFKRKRQSHRCP